MIDFQNLEQYKENNRIEAKKALGGLPRSIWETYSAFANTLGGVILLGVEEYSDKSLHAIDLPDPVGMVQEFWEKINDPRIASANILSEDDVEIRDLDGNHIIVIDVPRAHRLERPVYIDRNPMSGSYRRTGEGDYRCSREEVEGMLRDAAVHTPDMQVLTRFSPDVFDSDTVLRFRTSMGEQRPGHAWESLDETEFLYKLGALGKGPGGSLHPTGAGLLMFGCEYEIIREFPNYLLDYREEDGSGQYCRDRLISSSGDWSGNLFDFYLRVYDRISRDIEVPFIPEGSNPSDTPVHRALREALVNSLVNADYYGRQGLVVTSSEGMISISNPGAFRIGLETAKAGGVSDPRNAGLIRMFYLVNASQRAGNGILNIYSVWKEQGWVLPTIKESFHPERITLSLAIQRSRGETSSPRAAAQKAALIEYLTDHISADAGELSTMLGATPDHTMKLLRSLIRAGALSSSGPEDKPLYHLKA